MSKLANSLEVLLSTFKKLRNPDTGCPWDREQDFKSIASCAIEEAYEVADAIEREDFESLKAELGDLLLQILLHSKIAEDNNYFSIVDVVNNLQHKLIERHPHVFGNVVLENAEDVEKQWEEIKKTDETKSIFDDIDQKLPSITKAFKTQRKAKKINLTYANYEEALQDLLSEVEELQKAKDNEDRKSEIGDILFSVVNVCRHLDADPEIQLNQSTSRFIQRAKYVEKNFDEDADIEQLWKDAKKSQIK